MNDKNFEKGLKRNPIDRTKEAIETLRESVKEIIEIDDLKDSIEEEQLTKNRILTIVSWFSYLKNEKPDTKEYEEAKDLLISIGKKHPKLAEWCEDLINKP